MKRLEIVRCSLAELISDYKADLIISNTVTFGVAGHITMTLHKKFGCDDTVRRTILRKGKQEFHVTMPPDLAALGSLVVLRFDDIHGLVFETKQATHVPQRMNRLALARLSDGCLVPWNRNLLYKVTGRHAKLSLIKIDDMDV